MSSKWCLEIKQISFSYHSISRAFMWSKFQDDHRACILFNYLCLLDPFSLDFAWDFEKIWCREKWIGRKMRKFSFSVPLSSVLCIFWVMSYCLRSGLQWNCRKLLEYLVKYQNPLRICHWFFFARLLADFYP